MRCPDSPDAAGEDPVEGLSDLIAELGRVGVDEPAVPDEECVAGLGDLFADIERERSSGPEADAIGGAEAYAAGVRERADRYAARVRREADAYAARTRANANASLGRMAADLVAIDAELRR